MWVLVWYEKLKKEAGASVSHSFVNMPEPEEEDLFDASALAFLVQAMELNPVPFPSFGIAVALVCDDVSSFFLWPTDLIAIGEVKYFHYRLSQKIEIFKGNPGGRLAS